MAPEPGVLVGDRWRLGSMLGRGGMADVYEACDEATGTSVAVKMLRAVDIDAVRRFRRELQTLESLDHPGIVRLLADGDYGGVPFLVLDLVRGGTLARALGDGPLGPERAAALGAEVADALAHIHARGVVHRDVKPANILLGADGRPQLADLGIARLVDATALTQSGGTMGTAAYVAPEQVQGNPVEPPADIYSLGLVVLEAATGERAFAGSGTSVALARLVRSPDVPASLPDELADVLRSMTAMAPADRPTAAEVSARLAPDRGRVHAVVGAIASVDTDGETGVVDIVQSESGSTEFLPIVVQPEPGPLARERGAAIAPVLAAASSRWQRLDKRARSTLIAIGCFFVGFLAVLALDSAFASDGGDPPILPVSTTVTTVAPPPTPPPTTAEPEEDEGRGNGNGNGNGRDRDRDRDDDD